MNKIHMQSSLIRSYRHVSAF